MTQFSCALTPPPPPPPHWLPWLAASTSSASLYPPTTTATTTTTTTTTSRSRPGRGVRGDWERGRRGSLAAAAVFDATTGSTASRDAQLLSHPSARRDASCSSLFLGSATFSVGELLRATDQRLTLNLSDMRQAEAEKALRKIPEIEAPPVVLGGPRPSANANSSERL
ncbi:hypothetical protein CRUP_028114 [Coryphaenoides rupestris]|nr:hypothetical protein CRUP_028114 [Coryphaenoides rupestris]